MSIDRRDFIKLGALGALAFAENPKELLRQDAGQIPNMAKQAKPITREEYVERQERARRYMREAGINAVMLTGGTSLNYFTGTQWGTSERMFAALIPAKGELAFVTPAFEKDRAMEQIKFAGDVRTWEEDESPYQLVAQVLKDRGITAGKLGIEETVDYRFSNGVARVAPAIELTSADPVTARCRGVKTQHELDLMRLANQITLKAYDIALKSLREGMTHVELGQKIAAAHRELGAGGSALVLFGAWSASPHGTVTPQKLKEGDIVLVDGGCSVMGYQSDITRTTVFGKPSEKQLKVWDIVKRAQAAALKAARPGVACEDIDAAARRVIEEAGYGPGYKYFTHRVGHGIGMDGHEWTYLVRGNQTKLEAGMTFSDEPGIYIPGEFGVRHEDIMVVTEKGAELFTGQAASIDNPCN
ncbi:MAG: M24 family metallopeptidase [Blastocatellia bacterium]